MIGKSESMWFSPDNGLIATKCNISVALKRGRIAQIPGGWAYRLGKPGLITVGVVTSNTTSRGQISDQVQEKLSLPPTQFSLLGRRSASPQWAEEAIINRKLAIGDAALAFSPIAGQGIRFALSSALAGAAVVRTWRDLPENQDCALEFYRTLVNGERQKHLKIVNSFYENQPATLSTNNAVLPSIIHYSGKTIQTGIYLDGLIQPQEAIEDGDGNIVRWLGRFDLLSLQDLCKMPLPTVSLIEQLQSYQLSQTEAISLIKWCLQQKILS